VRILQATAKKLHIPVEKCVVTVAEHGNTSAASVPLALDEAVRDGRITRGQHLLLEGVGWRFHLGRHAPEILKAHAQNDDMKFAFVYPGQGSQSLGMMAAYGDAPVVRATFDEASNALGRDLWQARRRRPRRGLSLTVNTQPLMLTADIAVYRLWLERAGPVPAMVAGHSLGEYAALVAAGVIELKHAVPLVELRAKAMQAAVPAGEGAMAAVMGLDAEGVVAACAEAAQGQVVQAVNFNEPKQTVIAGHKAAVERAAEAVKARGAKRALMLPVSAPFHCALMQPAADALKSPLANPVHGAAIPGGQQRRCRATERSGGDPRRTGAPGGGAGALGRDHAGMHAAGVTHVFECGPGKVLAGLVKRCVDGLTGAPMNDLAGVEAALAAVKGAEMSQQMTPLKGQIALVTGASRGLGRAIALELGAQGATVVGTATSDAGAAEIQQAFDAAGITGLGHGGERHGRRRLRGADRRRSRRKYGAVSVLVNNAGITRDNLAMRMKDEEWDLVIDTNLKAVFRLAKLVMRGMMKARFGRIINITSVVGEAGNPGQANYAAAKAGVAGMSRALAQELGSRNITVNCVAPGFIDTDMTRALPDAQRDALLGKIPLGRLGQPEEIAATVAFLASPRAGYITGTTINVNGGMYMA
jgi:3-oxoacyl-(acyl-carrier-protein) reductase/malonyl CoA-acyl carrier protein transacylase